MEPNNNDTGNTIMGIGGVVCLYLLLWGTWNIVIAGKLWQEAPIFTWLEAALMFLTTGVILFLFGVTVKYFRRTDGTEEDYFRGVSDGMMIALEERDEDANSDT